MNQKTKKQAMYWLKVAVVGIALGLGLQFVRAWTEPTAAPPGGNVGAPINTGSQTQTKSGGLNIGERLKVGDDTTPPVEDLPGQIKFDGVDYWGYVPGAGWKSFTAIGGGSVNHSSCTISRIQEPNCGFWGSCTIIPWNTWFRLDNAPFVYNWGGYTQATEVYFDVGASEGTFPHSFTLTIPNVVLSWNDPLSPCACVEGQSFQCLDGVWVRK